jgi:hypothetical protein
MPYHVKNQGSGYVLCNKDTGKCYSKKPLSHAQALAQLRAIEANTKGK